MFVQKGLPHNIRTCFHVLPAPFIAFLPCWIWPQIVLWMPWRLNKVRIHSLNTAHITMGRNSFKRKFQEKILHNFWLANFWLPNFWLVLSAKNGILLPKLFWPTVRKKCSSDWKNLFEIWGLRPKICKIFEITRTIYSNSERSEQILVTECFFNLFLEVSLS